jgi:DNA repair protein RadC
VDELAAVKGVGPAKAVQLKAAFEIGIRLARQRVDPGPVDTPERVCELVGDEMRLLNHESVRVLLLNTRLRLIGLEEISRGLLDQALVHAREVFAPAIARHAYAIILVHNHPSGDPSPSPADMRMTDGLKRAGQTLNIPLTDHIIIGRPSTAYPGGWFSFRSAGHL